MSRIVDIADAVVAELNTGTFSQQFVAERVYLPSYEQEQLDVLRVPVLARGVTHERASREASDDDIEIQVGVMKRVNVEEMDQMDAMTDLVQEVMDWMATRPLKCYEQAVWVRSVNDPLYNATMLDTHRVFQSVITLTYKMIY